MKGKIILIVIVVLFAAVAWVAVRSIAEKAEFTTPDKTEWQSGKDYTVDVNVPAGIYK